MKISMDYKQRFIEIRDLLKSYQALWYEEILNDYPHTLKNYPKSWVDQLDELSLEDRWKIDAKLDFSKLEGNLKVLVERIRELSSFPESIFEQELPKEALLGMNQKKVHEISRIAPFIGELQKKHNFNRGFDIGGGKGHLARTLAHYFDLESICLDPDLDLIKAGKKLLVKLPIPTDAKNFTYLNNSLGTHIYNPDIKASENELLFDNDSLAIGLHTCGPLSLRLMERAKNLVNVGCCYLKLNPKTQE
jgi:hypothetical protein